MSTPVKIFFLGATGYIGGSVLNRFLEHRDAAQFAFTVLVRSADKAEKLKALGLKPVIGTLQDLTLLEDLSADADIVVSTADCDDVPMIKAILKGMKKHHATTGAVPILLHTSGTGVLADDAAGDRPWDVIYNDNDADQIESLADTQQHRYVDLEIVRADKEGYVKTYIVLPSTIYGIASGRLADEGIQNKQSVQIPSIIRASLGRKRGGMVGNGLNIWNNVHIGDVSNLYIVIYDAIKSNPDSVPHGREGFYIGENGEHTLHEVGKRVAEELVALGKATDPVPTPFTEEEIKTYFGGSTFWGTNSRGRSNRSKAVGWKPAKTTKDMLDSIRPEIEFILTNPSSKWRP